MSPLQLSFAASASGGRHLCSFWYALPTLKRNQAKSPQNFIGVVMTEMLR
jgi:hypothetical protein